MVDVPYHTHEFTIPTASEGEIRAGVEDGKAITPDKLAPVLAEKADKATTLEGYGIEDAATKAQGDKADTAVQPDDLSAVGFSGNYSDLLNLPLLGGSSTLDVGNEANTVAAGDDPRIVNAVQETRTVLAGEGLFGGGSLADNIEIALSSTALVSLSLAESAVQPSNLKSLAYKDKIATADIDATGSDDSDAILTKGGLWIKPTGVGDMLQAVYDSEGSGVVDRAKHAHTSDQAGVAEIAAKVPWGGVQDTPINQAHGIAPLDADRKVPKENLPEPDNWALQPIGVPIPIFSNLSGVFLPPKNKDYRYVLLTAGQTGSGGYNQGILTSETVSGTAPTIMATAQISLITSLMNGETVNLINTSNLFLRAGTSNAIEGSQNLNHSHTATTNSTGAHTHTGTAASAGAHTHTASTNNTGGHTHTLIAGGTSNSGGKQATGSGTSTQTQTTSNAGSHSHTVTINSGGGHTHSVTTVSAGDHSHTVTVAANGGNEARPRNLNIQYIMRIA